MRLAISNIAWDPTEDEAISRLLAEFKVDAIDVAHGKYFPEPGLATGQDIADVRAWWNDQGIEITGMQALLFGTDGLNIFGTPEIQVATLQHLKAVCRIGGLLGATRLVFGSPKNRDRSMLDDEKTANLAVDFFRRLGDIASDYGVEISLEPNPSRYGANFMVNTDETASVVNLVDHPAIRMQLDTGALTINGEEPARILAAHSNIIGHIHASEPDLLPLGDGGTDHANMAKHLGQKLPTHVVSIETLATHTEPHLVSIRRSLSVAVHHYRYTEA